MFNSFFAKTTTLVFICVTAFAGGLVLADTVIPEFAATGEAPGAEGTSLGTFSNSAQVVYDEALVMAAGLQVGDEITGLSFRVDFQFDAPIWSVDRYKIAMASSVNSAGSLDPDFTVNRGVDYLVVRDGPLSYDGTEYTTDGFPNDFGPAIEFQTPFIYAGGDLLLEYTHSVIDPSAMGVVVSAADATEMNAGIQSQFSAGFDTTMESFGGFGDQFGVVIKLHTPTTGGGFVTPDAFTNFRGSPISSNLTDFIDSDDISATYNPGFTLNSLEAPVWLIFNGNAPAAVDFIVESNAGTPGLTYTVEALNYPNGGGNAYDVLGTQSESFNADSVTVFPIVPADHIDSDGSVQSRVGWRQTGFVINFPWEVRVDQVGWNQ